jgi:hypothetical protein
MVCSRANLRKIKLADILTAMIDAIAIGCIIPA